jgi:hypothetical protein
MRAPPLQIRRPRRRAHPRRVRRWRVERAGGEIDLARDDAGNDVEPLANMRSSSRTPWRGHTSFMCESDPTYARAPVV